MFVFFSLHFMVSCTLTKKCLNCQTFNHNVTHYDQVYINSFKNYAL